MKHYRVESINLSSHNVLHLVVKPKHKRDLIDYTPGQYAALGFKKNGKPSPMRCFSIVSSPNNIGFLEFAIKVEGDFTKSLTKLEINDSVFIHGPFGDFVIDEQFDRNIILLAAGIGVTPFVSMLRYANESKQPNNFTLLYSSQYQSGIALHNEIRSLEAANPKFKAAYFITKGEIDELHDHHALKGRITEERLNKITDGQYNRYSFFICGPGRFIEEMRSILERNGTDDHRIVTEDFVPTNKINEILAPKDKATKITYGLSAATLLFGIAFIMALDLSRAVPKLTAATSNNATTTSQSQTVSPSTSTTNQSSTSNSNDTTSSTNSSSTSGTSSATSQSSPSTQSTQTYYQAPVTSVS